MRSAIFTIAVAIIFCAVENPPDYAWAVMVTVFLVFLGLDVYELETK